jgi:hypothetical protein
MNRPVGVAEYWWDSVEGAGQVSIVVKNAYVQSAMMPPADLGAGLATSVAVTVAPSLTRLLHAPAPAELDEQELSSKSSVAAGRESETRSIAPRVLARGSETSERSAMCMPHPFTIAAMIAELLSGAWRAAAHPEPPVHRTLLARIRHSLASPSDVHNVRFDAAHTDAEIRDLLAHPN